ncbi:MAG: AAA family ATPase [Sphaerochaetaceae bacterium]|jgi:putative ATPase|nr:AAA family ATPase [Sphaerochaetaceae bacterium]
MMDLFSHRNEEKSQPLAYRMRPRTLDEYIGQDHIISPGRLLRRAIQADQLSSLIFYGPPGTGKTTLARVIANTTRCAFATLNAVLSGVKELRYEIDEAKKRLEFYGKRTILFVDEVHRWNKSQQDALLPWVENGTCILIGATTENPYFEVNSALVSRSRIFQLLPLTSVNLWEIAKQALQDSERGYGKWNVEFEPGALEHLVEIANGDARSLLNALQLAVETSPEAFPPPEGQIIHITMEAAEESVQRKVVLYDKEGDYHFDIISAFIKSLRGSDPDAALYWLARMVAAGEDPKFIFRRMLISACEDIGLADPMAIQVVEADAQAFERIGLPEGRFHLTHAALYLATAPKSNSTLAFFDALKAIEEERDSDVPNHLKDASRDQKGFGHGEGYLYPHAYQDHWVAQQYLPTSLQGKVFYRPSEMGYEAKIRADVLKRREAQLEATSEDEQPEHFTFSPAGNQRERWIQRANSERGAMLEKIRDAIFSNLHIQRHDRVLVINAGHGLLVWEAFRKTPEGLTVAICRTEAQFRHVQHYARTLEEIEQPIIVKGEPETALIELDRNIRFETIIGRNMLSRLHLDSSIIKVLVDRMVESGTLVSAETVPSKGSKLSDFVRDENTKRALLQAEELIYGGYNEETKAIAWQEKDLVKVLSEYHLESTVEAFDAFEQRYIQSSDISRWIERTYKPAWQALGIAIDSESIEKSLLSLIGESFVSWKHRIAIVVAKRKKVVPRKNSGTNSRKGT